MTYFILTTVLLLQILFFYKDRSLPLFIAIFFSSILLIGYILQLKNIVDLLSSPYGGAMISSIYILIGVLHRKTLEKSKL